MRNFLPKRCKLWDLYFFVRKSGERRFSRCGIFFVWTWFERLDGLFISTKTVKIRSKFEQKLGIKVLTFNQEAGSYFAVKFMRGQNFFRSPLLWKSPTRNFRRHFVSWLSLIHVEASQNKCILHLWKLVFVQKRHSKTAHLLKVIRESRSTWNVNSRAQRWWRNFQLDRSSS